MAISPMGSSIEANDYSLRETGGLRVRHCAVMGGRYALHERPRDKSSTRSDDRAQGNSPVLLTGFPHPA
jgi:hypothetical protein